MTAGGALERGLWGVLATPFTAEGTAVDHDSLARQVRLQKRAGARGLTALGVFGEAASLTLTERSDVLRCVATETDLPFVVGFPERTVDALLSAMDTLIEACPRPPRALMVQIASDEPDVVAATIRRLSIHSGLPIVLQDYPLATGVQMAPEDVARVVADSGMVCAVKAEGVPPLPTIAAVAGLPGTSVFGGLGGVGLLDELQVGASGVMTGFSCPEGLARTVRAWQDEGFDAARRAYMGWLPLVNFEAQGRFALAVRKEALRQRGVFAHATVRAPAPPCPEFVVPLLRRHLAAVADQLEDAPWVGRGTALDGF